MNLHASEWKAIIWILIAFQGLFLALCLVSGDAEMIAFGAELFCVCFVLAVIAQIKGK